MPDRLGTKAPARAVIFDLDGVITSTASLHAEAWREVFDEFLARRTAVHGDVVAPFDIRTDYRLYVDGKPRYDGVAAFLTAREVHLPAGTPDDPIDCETICGLGNRKDAYFKRRLEAEGAHAYPDTVALLERLATHSVPMAVVSSSRNAREVLQRAGLTHYFADIVDGAEADELGLPGKPHPAAFLEAARRLDVEPASAVVVEDAVAGVAAGRQGGFGLVIGVDRDQQAADLQTAGADLVVHDLAEVSLSMLGLQVGWQTLLEGFDPATEGQRESLCTLGNGYFATRGAVPEAGAEAPFSPATYIAGIFNRPPATDLVRETDTETIVNAPNWLSLRFRIAEGDWFDLRTAEVIEHRHELDVRTGLLLRHLRIRDEAGRRTRVTQRRFVSLEDPHVGALESTFLAENWDGVLLVESGIDGRVANRNVARYASFEAGHLVPVKSTASHGMLTVLVRTAQSGVLIAEAARHRISADGGPASVERGLLEEEAHAAETFTIALQEGRSVTVEKVVAIYTSKDSAISEPAEAARLWAARAGTFDELFARHRLAWRHLWGRARIEVEDGDPEVSRILDLHLFHLLQTVSENSAALDVGVPARGLHGEGYRGHVFWDELLIFPFLNLRFPELTRALLLYRYRRLPAARWAAREAGYAGAMFPWQSGSDGRDETPRALFNPRSGRWIADNSRLQRHVGIAVAYNVWAYYQVTDDIDFMSAFGAELIIEVARFFASVATYNPARDRYEIHGVMGPDEYHDGYPDRAEPGLDNNAYTNVMCAWLLARALDVLDVLPAYDRERLVERLGVQGDEIEGWDEISRKLFVPIDEDGIIAQFEGYAALEEFDWDGYRARYGHIERLDLILEAEGDTPNRYKLSKQPDVLMLFYLLSADELREVFSRLGYEFDGEAIPRNIAYYQGRTAHGSTLSRVVMSWILSRADRVGSWDLFRTALASDVEDIQGGTTREGIHLGAMAGTVDLVQRCYAGIETHDDVLWFGPLLPAELRAIRFDVHYRRQWLDVQVLPDRVRISTQPGNAAPIRVGYKGEVVMMSCGETHEFRLARLPQAGQAASPSGSGAA